MSEPICDCKKPQPDPMAPGICEGCGGQVRVYEQVMLPVFEIDINWHPEYNTPEQWAEFKNLFDYINEYQLNINIINDMMEAGAIRIKAT